MNTQHERELEKNTDDEFDFFKQNKSSALPKNNVVLDKNMSQQIKEKFEAQLKLNKRIALAGIFIPMFLCIAFSEMQNKPTYIVKEENKVVKVVKPIEVVAQQTNNKDQPFNVDYSKLSKEDGERVKYALDQFSDIQKTLIETSKSK